MLGQVLHAVSLREVLVQHAVGVLVGAALPGVVARGEVETRRGGPLDRRVVMELGSVVHGDGAHRARLGGDRPDAGLQPDIFVVPTVSDIARARDAELDAVRTQTRRQARRKQRE